LINEIAKKLIYESDSHEDVENILKSNNLWDEENSLPNGEVEKYD